MRDYTMQELFDISVAHLRKQGERSEIVDGGRKKCVYRGPNGLMCAIGPLIPDEEYKAEFEGRPANALLRQLNPQIEDRVVHLAQELQIIHDDKDISIFNWECHFEELARKHGLNYEAPNAD